MSRRAHTTRAADLAAQPGVQRLLALPGNAAARAAVAKLSPMAAAAGPDSDVVTAREEASAAGRRSSRSGTRTELLVIGAYHAAARAAGLAWMEKIPTPTKNIGPAHRPDAPGAFAAVYSAKPSVDCHGFTLHTPTATRPTRAILEECKGVTKRAKRTEFCAFSVSRVEPHQRDALTDAHDAGHVAVVTLVFGEGAAARVYVVPWSWMAARVTVHEQEVAAFRATPETYLVRAIATAGGAA